MIPLDKVLALAGVSPSLSEEQSINTLDDLAQAARAHRLQNLPGLNISLEYHILRCIEELHTSGQGIVMDVSFFQADEVRRWLAEHDGVERAEIVGALRRGRGLVQAVELLAAAQDPAGVLRSFASSSLVSELRSEGKSQVEVISTLGLPVTLYAVEPDRFGAILLNLTGSRQHWERLQEMAWEGGLQLTPNGLFAADGSLTAGANEGEIYRRIGLPFISPELRENQGEIEAALKSALPRLITADQIQGDLHMHTAWTDGLDSIEAMAEVARAKGYRYIAIGDHSPFIKEANGLDQVRLAARNVEIERLNHRYSDFAILRGLEVDIRANGQLDTPDEVLQDLDIVIASIHIPYGQDTKTVTRRLIAAMEHPLVDVIGHPTGRLLKRPDLYMADVDELLKAAARTGTALEINSGPDRLDLSAEWARRAREYGIPLTISSDAHSVQQLSWIRFGLATARRAWLEGADVLNALPFGDLRKRLKRRRALSTDPRNGER
jgi:DNA polymerase (family 10)